MRQSRPARHIGGVYGTILGFLVKGTDMKIIGHRGARGYEPENTLRSFEKAIELGADMIEFDVYALDSGELVIIHDHRVDRTTNGEGRVLEHSYSRLRSLDAGEGEPIPTLEDALQLVKGRVQVNIELKGPRTAEAVARIIEGFLQRPEWTKEHFLVSSFDHHELRDFRTAAPDIAIAVLEHTIPLNFAATAEALGAVAVHPNHEFLNQAYVDDAHARGLKVNAYTVNFDDDLEQLHAWGVDGVVTDFPDRMARAYDKVK